jgi:DNA (cytosine-5)-methyltransferase 1
MGGSTPADVLDLTTDPEVALALMGDSNRVVRDDFAGPGGWSTGIADLLHAADLTEVALEWDASACLTRVANGHVNTIRADVSAYPVAPFLGRTVGYIGSPPCQTFSMAGGGTGRAHVAALCDEVRGILLGTRTYEEALERLAAEGALDDKDGNPDPRNGLILIPARVIRALLDHDGKGPTDLEWVALEQVPPAGIVFDAYANTLRELGFSVVAPVINSADYGVPQTRERKFVIASRVRRVTVPEPTHTKGGEDEGLFGPSRLPWVSMARALGWLGTVAHKRGAGMAERHGDREPRSTDDPAPTITGGSPRRLAIDAVRTVELVHGSQPNVARRTLDHPAATIALGHDSAGFRFEGDPDDLDALLEARRAGSDKFDGHWAEERPATVVASREIVQHPGATKNRFNDSDKTRNDGLRITEAEGGILQGFPADYRWEGSSKGKRWEQIGNVVCPPVARRVVAELLGVEHVRT